MNESRKRFPIAVAIVAVGLSFAPNALACTGPPPPTFKEVFPNAKHVFIFRLDSVESQRMRPSFGMAPGNAVGHFTIIRTFRGAPTYKKISFSTDICGGNRFDVGHYFLVAVSGAGDTIEMKWHDETVVDISTDVKARPVSLYRALRRNILPPGFPSRWQSNYTLTTGYPD